MWVTDFGLASLENDVGMTMIGMILRTSRAKGHLLSRGGILADHIHLALGCPLESTPAEIATCYMNNVAYVHGMKRVFQFGAHLRTFSEYDLGAIERDPPPDVQS